MVKSRTQILICVNGVNCQLYICKESYHMKLVCIKSIIYRVDFLGKVIYHVQIHLHVNNPLLSPWFLCSMSIDNKTKVTL